LDAKIEEKDLDPIINVVENEGVNPETAVKKEDI
jgi:hypothetical protein